MFAQQIYTRHVDERESAVLSGTYSTCRVWIGNDVGTGGHAVTFRRGSTGSGMSSTVDASGPSLPV